MNMITTTWAALIVSALIMEAGAPAARTVRGGVEAGAPAAWTVRAGVEAQPQTVTPGVQAKGKMVDVVRVGCLKAWQPGTPDATRMPDPPKTGTYILAPLIVDPNRATVDMPTYVLVGGSTVNFPAHLNHKVEISGVESVAQLPPSPQEVAAAPAVRPENKPDTRTMPSLTVQSLKMISTACP